MFQGNEAPGVDPGQAGEITLAGLGTLWCPVDKLDVVAGPYRHEDKEVSELRSSDRSKETKHVNMVSVYQFL